MFMDFVSEFSDVCLREFLVLATNNQLDGQLGEVERLIGPSVEAMGFRLVRLALMGEARKLTLQIMAEPKDNSAMNVDHCADLSRAISAILDVEDPISTAYSLEVSSPGVERPLMRSEDFARFSGNQVRIETAEPQNGQRRFVGKLLGVDEDHVVLSVTNKSSSEKELTIPFKKVARAELVLTDDVIRDTLKKRKS